MNTRGKVALAGAVTALLVVGGAGTAYATHFQDRALPGSTLGGVSVAGMTRDEVAATVSERAARTTVTIDTGTAGDSRTLHLADLGYAVDVDATVDAVFSANESWSSFATSLVSSRDVDAVVTTDPARTAAVATELIEQTDRAGRDAGVKLASDKKSFVAVAAVEGQRVAPESFQDVIATSARDLAPTTATVTFVDAAPTVTTADAERAARAANALVARKVSVSDGEDQHTASRTLKASWVSIPSTDGTLGSPALDVAKVKAWVSKVATSAKVEPRAGVRNVDADGDILSVYTDARDGKTVSNVSGLAKATAAALAAGRDYKGKFAYDTMPAKWTEHGWRPVPSTWPTRPPRARSGSTSTSAGTR